MIKDKPEKGEHPKNAHHRILFFNYLLICHSVNPLSLFLRATDIKPHPDPLMGRGYLNVRATGGAVKSLPTIGEDLGVVRGPP